MVMGKITLEIQASLFQENNVFNGIKFHTWINTIFQIYKITIAETRKAMAQNYGAMSVLKIGHGISVN